MIFVICRDSLFQEFDNRMCCHHIKSEPRTPTFTCTPTHVVVYLNITHCTLTNTYLYSETIKWDLNRRLIYECRCDERLKDKVEGSTRLTYTGLLGGLEHLKIETRFVYYETIQWNLSERLICECRCDERLNTKAEGSTRLTYTVFHGGLEHLKIKTRLIDQKFASVMGECVFVKL
jgi:hypothetical protein